MRLIVFTGLIFLSSLLVVRANNDIFPAEAAAQNAINWQNGYFYINGKPTFLTSGEMHYARIPRELWRDRIWRSKQMGFNCMQMYVFWNASEPKENQWDFTDNNDLDAWLSLVQEMGMYAVVRVGPYSCAEWEHGGFPAWLTAKPGMHVRDNDSSYIPYEDTHIAQVEAIVAKHQINHGGNVIMVQLENEHPAGWGTDDKNPYLKHMVEQARINGLEIPVFLSGLHHGGEPSGEAPYPIGNSPWYTTEFWTGWIGRYGNMDPGMLDEKVRGTWKIIAFGGAGYDYYMVHGGTNFGYSGDTLQTTYDYSAPIGETGKFNNLYYPARRAAWFAQSFSDLLTGSHNDPDLAKSDLPGVRVTTRTNPTQGSIVFVDNFAKKVDAKNLPEIAPDASAYQAPGLDKSTGAVSTRLTVGDQTWPQTGSLKVLSSEPSTVLLNVPWTATAKFTSIVSNVLFRHTIGTLDYWVCYGAPGESGEVTVTRNGTPTTVPFTYPTDESIQEVDLDSGDQHQAKLLVMNRKLTDKTWLVKDTIYVGPSFVREDGTLEFPAINGGQATIYSAAGKNQITQAPVPVPDLPVLANWSWRDAAPERTPDYPTTDWHQTQGPEQMGIFDSYQNSYGWYRTIIHSDTDKTTALELNGVNGKLKFGEFAVFLNGQSADLNQLNLKSGANTLAILCKVARRPKGWNFTGVFNPTSPDPQKNAWRGIWGPVMQDGQDSPLSTAPWFFRPGLNDLQETAIIGRVLNWPDFLAHSPWQTTPPTTPGLPIFWKTTFTYHPTPDLKETLALKIAKGGPIRSGNFWLNGHNLGEIPQKEPLYVPECWLKEGDNDLVVFDLQGGQPDQILFQRIESFALAKGQ